jgi:hypothetical protein
MSVPAPARDYLIKALDANPLVMNRLLQGIGSDSQVWDKRPDPDRFTLREVLAHVADWEPVWLERLQRIATEDRPFLPSVDESAIAAEGNYGSAQPAECLGRIREGRARLTTYLKSLSDEAWDREGDREFVGTLSLYQQAVFALSHDGYHLRQIVEWTAEAI